MFRRFLAASLAATSLLTSVSAPAFADHQVLQRVKVISTPVSAYVAAGEKVLLKLTYGRKVQLQDLRTGQLQELSATASANSAMAMNDQYAVYQTNPDASETHRLVLQNLKTGQKAVMHTGGQIERAYLGTDQVVYVEERVFASEVRIHTYHIATGAKRQALVLNHRSAQPYSIRSDGRYIFWAEPETGFTPATFRQNVKAYDLISGQTLTVGHRGQVNLTSVNQGRVLFIRFTYSDKARTGSQLVVWNPATGEEKVAATLGPDPTAAVLDGDRVAWAEPAENSAHHLMLHDLRDGSTHRCSPPEPR